jgi:hypothetical protein
MLKEQNYDNKQQKSYCPPPPHEFPLSKIILTTLLVFSLLLASCGGKAGGDDAEDDTGLQIGNGAITGGTNGIWSITATLKYDTDISNLAEAKSITDFGYSIDWNEQNNEVIFPPISNVIPNSSITVSGGKVTIKLGVPKSEYLELTEDDSPTITVTPSNAKGFLLRHFNFFNSSDGKYGLYTSFYETATTEVEVERLVYVDRDVTIKGTETWTDSNGTTYTEKWDASFKAGWNYLIETHHTENNGTTMTASQSLSGGINWIVCER